MIEHDRGLRKYAGKEINSSNCPGKIQASKLSSRPASLEKPRRNCASISSPGAMARLYPDLDAAMLELILDTELQSLTPRL